MSFIHDDFLLQTKTAKKLYHDYAEGLPIIDYHCHIDPGQIAENKKFENITRIWLGGDHYKWRLIRSDGVCEKEITGSADDKTKFMRFAEALPKSIGNPMFHWTHLELKRYFDYDGILCPQTAEEVWNLCNEKLQSDNLSVCNIIKDSNVVMIGTTDDPVDSLENHKLIADSSVTDCKVYPSFRPDKAVNIEKDGFCDYLKKLSEASGIKIESVDDVKKALTDRLEFFCKLGCRASDHGLDYAVYAPAAKEKIEATFAAAMSGEKIDQQSADEYKTEILLHLGREYQRLGVVMQLHYGAQRNTNTRMFKSLGPDTGFDCISVRNCGEALTGFLNALEVDGALPKTIIYSLNPNDNQLIDTVLGCFQGTEAKGKIQHGSAWWFSDTKNGMEAQLKSLAELSVLGNFVGMLTDSRSFLSYTRHEYFRRILCNLIGNWVENGEYPCDWSILSEIVKNICYYNAREYFGL